MASEKLEDDIWKKSKVPAILKIGKNRYKIGLKYGEMSLEKRRKNPIISFFKTHISLMVLTKFI